MLVAALPRCSRKKWSNGCSGARAGQQTVEEVPGGTEERDHPLDNGPGMVGGAAGEGGRRCFSGATRAGKKHVDLPAANLQFPVQVTRPRILMRDTQRLSRTPLAGIH